MNREEEQPKQESAKKPGKDDVHEQREPAQKQEGAVGNTKQDPPPRH